MTASRRRRRYASFGEDVSHEVNAARETLDSLMREARTNMDVLAAKEDPRATIVEMSSMLTRYTSYPDADIKEARDRLTKTLRHATTQARPAESPRPGLCSARTLNAKG